MITPLGNNLFLIEDIFYTYNEDENEYQPIELLEENDDELNWSKGIQVTTSSERK